MYSITALIFLLALGRARSGLLGGYDNSLPKQGLLYNYGSYGFVSTPKAFNGIPMGNLVAIGRDQDIKLGIALVQLEAGVDVYNLKVVPFKEADKKNVGNTSEEVLAVSPIAGIVMKMPYDEKNPGQYFEVKMSKNFPGYFRIGFNGLCLTPNRKQLLTLSICWKESSRTVIKQMFKFYKVDIDENGGSPKKIEVPKGISPYYFRGCAPCTRYIPDPSNGKYILVHSKSCERNCMNREELDPEEKSNDIKKKNPNPNDPKNPKNALSPNSDKPGEFSPTSSPNQQQPSQSQPSQPQPSQSQPSQSQPSQPQPSQSQPSQPQPSQPQPSQPQPSQSQPSQSQPTPKVTYQKTVIRNSSTSSHPLEQPKESSVDTSPSAASAQPERQEVEPSAPPQEDKDTPHVHARMTPSA
ncbi:uncharacterized protein NEMAJ01_1977 [Nematocida major]|uniref:uncharacterized protein n=1 Tax=Nematocida major TaxID=1912982 RepID=UPI002007C8D3|nr:uncharacterized protein NEMAJ01_1977 [Nematocida major]KAH9387081.1 hypothetical protein NEMAJ01_1977 [Nematocida major]